MSEKNQEARADAKRRAGAVFRAALEIDSDAERRAYVDAACAADPAIRGEVEALLVALDEPDGFLDAKPAAGLSVTQLGRSFPDMVAALVGSDTGECGQRIGAYELIRKIGEGGAGEVYLAEQTRPIRRRVALKIIKPGMDTRRVIARFETERQALALMDHPNVAHVYDAGATEVGRPFFVMEWVQGDRITEYCDAHRLDVAARMGLFTQVCHAIQHAHQKGIVHRDIKPSNVLVHEHDGVARPLVIDFGIAKSVGGELPAEHTLYNAAEPFIGTPAYMSPEQADPASADIDTRTDVYSLGMLLYELLAGAPAFALDEVHATDFDALRRVLRGKEPPRPSARFQALPPAERTRIAEARQLDPRRLHALLRGELDWIVCKAIEKDRARRYETVDALAADLGRFLRDEAVEARPPTRGYRLAKVVRRNRAVFAALGGVAFALVSGLALSTWFWAQERAARGRAMQAEQRAEQALLNEAALRRQAEAGRRLAEAARLLGINQPEAAEQLLENAPETASIEAAAAWRGLAKWYAAQGDDARAVRRFRTLLAVNRFDGWPARAADYLAAAAVFARAGQASDQARLEQQIARLDVTTLPPMVAVRLLRAALTRPVDAAELEHLRPLAARALAPAREPAVAAEWGAAAWQRLKLAVIGTDGPRFLSAEEGGLRMVVSGEDIWDTRDRFVFAWRSLAGDFDVQVRVRSIDAASPYARLGLMARDSLENATSRHVMIAVNADNTFQVLARPRAGATTLSLPPNPLPKAWGADSWVRLQREGSVFRGYVSNNGREWRLLDSYDSASGAEGPFGDPVFVGLAGCSHGPDSVSVLLDEFGPATAPNNETLLAEALWLYRNGDHDGCAVACHRSLAQPGFSTARTLMLRVLLALCDWKAGRLEAARIQLGQLRKVLNERAGLGSRLETTTDDALPDWIVAEVLLLEGEELVRR